MLLRSLPAAGCFAAVSHCPPQAAEVSGLARDLCVLQINPPQDVLRRLRPASLGTSADLRVGQAVNALGNPFGFDHTLTTGALHASERMAACIMAL